VRGRFVGSLQGVPGARHDRQRGIEMADGVASSTVRLDDPLSIRRLLPSSAQEAVEGGSASSPLFGGVPGVVGTGVGGGRSGAVLAGVVQGSGMSSGVGSAAAMSAGGSLAGLGSDVDASSGRFVGSLRNMPGARHDPQRGIESADGVASSNGRLDDSLSIRRLLPSSAQEAVETGSAVVADPGTAVAQPATPGVEAAPQPSAAVVHPSGKAAPGQTAPGQPGPEGSHHARAALDQAALVQAAPDRAALDQAVLVQAAPDPAALDQAVLVQAAPGQSGPEGSHHARAALDQAVLVQTAPGQATPVQPTPAQPTQTQPPNPGQLHQQSLNHPPLNHQLAQPLFELASAKPGEHVMTLRVSPEDLGPLTVRAHIDHAGVRIELFAAGDAGREAVRHVLPELRRGLEDAGATLNLSSQDSPQDSPHDNPQDAPTDRGDQRRHEPVFQAQAPQNVATGREPEQPKHDPETNRLDILV
ncbi:flagellar hook-length control protein FliK, partial [Paenarthrobacter sp. NPDC089989]|uniref:flagellar hook-length control protein FliK n=1 Tax=Paenarthrobacter sp. NPDC089989 TaxID=3364379 RepID=UPI0037F4A14D